MSRLGYFIGPLVVEDLSNFRFRVYRDFEFTFPTAAIKSKSFPRKPQCCTVKVKAGLVTDFASVPRFLWPILPPIGRYGRAAVIHDALYQFNVFPRKVCDEIFLLAMKSDCVSSLKATLLYLGTRLFGWRAYNRYKNRLVSGKSPLRYYGRAAPSLVSVAFFG